MEFLYFEFKNVTACGTIHTYPHRHKLSLECEENSGTHIFYAATRNPFGLVENTLVHQTRLVFREKCFKTFNAQNLAH